MTESARERRRVSAPVLLLSVATWAMLFVSPLSIVCLDSCSTAGSLASPTSFRLLLTRNLPSSLATGWVLMLVAMMGPTLIAPIYHLRERTFKHRRFRSLVFFLAGYAAIWMVAGGVLLTVKLGLSLLAPDSYLVASAVGFAAFVWQCSPAKQRCLNRGHHHRALAAYGLAADLDALRFGLTHGFWCVASCWALMLLPLFLPHGHSVAMVAVSFLMVGERLEQPRPLSWRLRGPGKLVKLMVTQTRIRLQALSTGFAPSSSPA